MVLRAARAKQVLEQMGAPIPRWLVGSDGDVECENRKATLRELRAIARLLLRDNHILRLIHRHPGSWTSVLAEHADVSKGEVHRAVNRLRKDGLAHLTNDKQDGRNIRRVWPGPARKYPPLKPPIEPDGGVKKTGMKDTSGDNKIMRSKSCERAPGGVNQHKRPTRQRQNPLKSVFHRFLTKIGGRGR